MARLAIVLFGSLVPSALSFFAATQLLQAPAAQPAARRALSCTCSTSDGQGHKDTRTLTEAMLKGVEEDIERQNRRIKECQAHEECWLEEACELEQECFKALGSGIKSQAERFAVVNKIADVRDTIAQTVQEELQGHAAILATLEARKQSYLNLLAAMRSGAARRTRTGRLA